MSVHGILLVRHQDREEMLGNRDKANRTMHQSKKMGRFYLYELGGTRGSGYTLYKGREIEEKEMLLLLIS